MKLNLLAPYQPSLDEPWNETKAAHLCRRAGFGAPRREIQEVLELGPVGAVDRFLRVESERDAEYDELFETVRQGLIAFQHPPNMQAWWLFRMQREPFPLREKMTLFWHGHFATSFRKVENMRLMHQQNETLRREALGDFRDLVLAVSRNPAMILWLDNQQNHKRHPNENFARELMELFTLGEGHYTEHDVREAARAFTGWHQDEFRFVFNREAHDFGSKEILGQRGNFNGDDVVDIVLQQPQAKRFLATKLLKFFVMPQPDNELVDEATQLLVDCNLETKWFLRTLFLSKTFYSDQTLYSKIKSPVEFVVGAVRDLDAVFPGQELAELMAGMGQELFAPPSVKGWDGERDWISSNAWLARGRFAEILSHAPGEERYGPQLPLESHVPFHEPDPAHYVNHYVERLVQGRVSDTKRRELIRFMFRTDDDENPELFRHEPEFRMQKSRGLIRLILTLPEYHVC
ncbi:MAG: hypothetical protein CMJ50_06935 [Planctomycetaceae bacterium]|nr:hypothetical protein [Planctomycetaceae bacterium]